MDRSTIHDVKQKGWANTQIAAFVGQHRDTIARVLNEPVDQQPVVHPRQPLAAVFVEQIERWLDDGVSVQRLIELARAAGEHPCGGSAVAFYHVVRPLRQARRALPAQVVVRFEGLPGELLQIDWGEHRQMTFTQVGLAGQTRDFFAARLNAPRAPGRWLWVRVTTDMQSETLLRCLIACLVDLGGGPWVVTSDNPTTIRLGRDAQQQPILHPAYQPVATEFGFHPSLCTPAAAQQKTPRGQALSRIWCRSSKPTSSPAGSCTMMRTWRRKARPGCGG